MSGWPTCDEVIAWLRDRDQPAMATVVEGLRDSERRCRNAAEQSVKAYHELKMRYEPPPVATDWKHYVAKPESSD
jgi:hypothetical protein